MHIAATSPLFSVVKKRSLGKRILEIVHREAILSPTNHSHHPEQMFEHPTSHRLLKLSSSYLEFHLRFLLLKPNENSGSILKEICYLQQVFFSVQLT